MKKLLSIICAFICLISVSALFCACGGNGDDSQSDTIYDYAEHEALFTDLGFACRSDFIEFPKEQKDHGLQSAIMVTFEDAVIELYYYSTAENAAKYINEFKEWFKEKHFMDDEMFNSSVEIKIEKNIVAITGVGLLEKFDAAIKQAMEKE